MAVSRIEEYRQQDGTDILKVICKPTKKFPEGGYFYCPAEAIDLVQKYSWRFSEYGKGKYRIIASVAASISSERLDLKFHKELFYMCNQYYYNSPYELEHINMLEFDCTDENLNLVTRALNHQNKYVRGYNICLDSSRITFVAQTNIQGNLLTFRAKDEADACTMRLNMELDYFTYAFDFKKYRRGSEDILDLERTGKISADEATYRHILKYADNAWYYLRYGLEEYFKDNHIPIPDYRLDAQGFMIHPITGQKLCPFTK